ncbi:MAG: NAD(+)/NADH kinase [Thermoplasmatota archaeon]
MTDRAAPKRMKLGIAAKADEPHRVKIARFVFDFLEPKAEVFVQDDLAKHFDGKANGVPIERMKIDALVTVGGDGTILHAMQRNPAPIFGINVGELGFLTEAEPIELPDALDRLLSGDYFVDSRLKIATTVGDQKLPNAVNEIVIKTARPSKMLHFALALGDGEIQRIRADGLIVATPTGSTSYAMSAGGPILDPHVEAMLVVPLAAFSLAARPILFPTTSDLRISLVDPTRDAILVVDGQHERLVHPHEPVAISASPERARFIRFRDSFYNRLAERFG